MLEEACFQREDRAVPPLPVVSDGRVDLKDVAALLQGSTERPIGLQMSVGTFNLVSLKGEARKLSLAQLRSTTGRLGTNEDPFIVRFLSGPNKPTGGCMALPPFQSPLAFNGRLMT